MKTKSEKFVVYHKDNAGRPDMHEGGPWFFEPAKYDDGEVYSDGYATAAEALAAAERWEVDRLQGYVSPWVKPSLRA
jgi:hypothetical protein